ncbi:MAG: DUF1549 and DUF1553 domain-containing protein [Pirellulales bacterium]
MTSGWRRLADQSPQGVACRGWCLGLLLLLLLPLGDAAVATEPADVPLNERPLEAGDFAPFAYRPLRVVPLPENGDRTWARVPSDRFIAARHEREGLRPYPPASPAVWLRRVSFDLRGLPPRPEEIIEFTGASAPDAAARLVDRWVASPTFGEQAAQSWLDLARFAESDGFEHDLVRPEAWRYRDWVIQALNADLPYDRFVAWQLAGDLLEPHNPAAQVATGFLLCGPDMPDLNLPDERRHLVLNDMAATVGSTLLGLQLECAQCHDHKYDPLSQADFYRWRGFFESTEWTAEWPLVGVPSDESVRSAWPRFLRQSSAVRRMGDSPWRVRAVRAGADRPARRYERGDFRQPRQVVPAAVPRIVLPSPFLPTPDPPGRQPPTNRAELAEWLAAGECALFDRVIVNRLWQEFFQVGLVASPSDWGLLGESPTHPELLDWLTLEWRRQGRSWKQFARDLVLSATYGQATRGMTPPGVGLGETLDAAREREERARASDPANRWLAGQRRRRLSAEALRDALLAASEEGVAGSAGPGVRPPLPPELVSTLLPGQWEVSPDPGDHRRRSVYLFVRRNLPFPWLAAFDRPAAVSSCPVRHPTTTAPQALALWNAESSLAYQQALTEVVLAEAQLDPDRVERLFLRTLGRWPTERELAEALEFVDRQTRRFREEREVWEARAPQLRLPPGESGERGVAWVDLSRVLVNLNEFLYLD